MDQKKKIPHEFVVNGINIECHFSPSDLVTPKIDDALETADSDISFALLSFIRDELGSEILYRHNNGVEVEGIIESEFDMGTEYTYLKDNGVAVESHIYPKTNTSQIRYHRCFNETSDPIVVTGHIIGYFCRSP